MSDSFTVACLQVNAGREVGPNVDTACRLARDAAGQGARLVLMPENVAMMEWGRDNILGKAMPEEDHAALAAFRDLARELGIWLHCGSLAVRLPGDMVANRTYVLDPGGTVVGRYDKIHMFDVDLGNGEIYRESSTFAPGDRAVRVETPWGGLGLSICYDLRFPHLFRALAQGGASFLAIPAAFTRVTGEAHWHVLLRARAIETGCYVFAPAQTGEHVRGRQTFGHALIIDPWGEVLADAGLDPGIILAEVDPARVADARRRIPALTHDRSFDTSEQQGNRAK
ncbi:MAG: carbon-nitrogen hydrolase family protein [Alphaproteobacteria bacterium]